MKKKILSLLLACSMICGLAACGNGDAGNSSGNPDNDGTGGNEAQGGADGVTTENITLTYWHLEDSVTIQYLAEKFMEMYPNITVEQRHMDGDSVGTDLSNAAASNTFPDLFTCTDADMALNNFYWADISEYFNADPESKNLMPTIEEYGIGCYDTSARFAVPMIYWPNAIFIDRNVVKTLNLEMPRTDWTWAEMIDLIKAATKDERTGMKYYGLGYYNRLDSLYGIAACSPEERAIKGEFGFNGTDFDLSYWAIGEQEFSDLKLAGYVAPQQETAEMEAWSGNWDTWFGATGRVAVFSEGFWTYMNLWGQEGYQEQYGLDIIPYVTPNVIDEKEHNVSSYMHMGGVSSSCEHPYEAYLLLKFMGWGIDGWKARLEVYQDTSVTTEAGVPLKNAQMPMPITLDEEVWAGYKALFPQDEDHKAYWDEFFASVTRPVPMGWQNIAGYWNFCDQYFNKIGIHDLVDAGSAKAADYVDEATRQANLHHAEAMIAYFGPGGYDVLSEEELAKYQAMVDASKQ